MKRKHLVLSAALLLSFFSVFAFVEDNDDCDPAWAPFWKTSCTYTAFDANGDLIMYKKTCKHFIVTTKCYTEALYDL